MSTIEGRTASRAREMHLHDRHPAATALPDLAALRGALAVVDAARARTAATGAAPGSPGLAPSPERALQVLQTEDLLLEGSRPLELLLDPLLPAGSVMLVHGPAGVGLSHFLIGCATALASGGECTWGRAPRPVRTALLAGSLPTTIISRRVAAVLAGHKADAGDRLTVVSVDEQAEGSPDLGRRPDTGILWRAIGAAEVLVIDDLAALLPSFHRAAGEQAAHLTQMLFAFRARGLTVVAGVHTGRKHEAGRVDRAAFASVDRVADIVVALRRPRERIEDGSIWCSIEIERAAHLPERERLERHRRLVLDPAAAPSAQEIEIVDPRKQAALELMAKGIAPTVAAAHAGVSRASAYRWRRQAAARRYDSRETVRFGADDATRDGRNAPQCIDLVANTEESMAVERVSRGVEMA